MFLADFRCQTNNKEKESERTIDSTFRMSSILTNMITSISHSTLTLQIVLWASIFFFFYPNDIRAYRTVDYRWLLERILRTFFLYFPYIFILLYGTPRFFFSPVFDCSSGIRASVRETYVGGNSNWRLADKLPRNCWSRHWKDLVT